MKRLQLNKAWILLCSIILVSCTAAEHGPYHHDGLSHHGANTPGRQHQKIIVPIGIQMPEDVLSTQAVACISADTNIFEIMNKARESCSGKDMRCTFYHFSNHGYENIGTLDIDKKLFNVLLMKYDNWLVTPENIVNAIPSSSDPMTKVDNTDCLDTGRFNMNNGYNKEDLIDISSHQTNQGVIDKLESGDNEVNHIKTHHIKIPPETHLQNHYNEHDVRLSDLPGKIWNNKNYMKLDAEYNDDHKYFEVFLPNDKNKGQPRTIYVEIDNEKNEFVLFDEEIDKELNSGKSIKIELDELSEIADVAFNNIAKSSIDKQKIPKHYANANEGVMISDINTNSAINEENTNLLVEEAPQNILQPSVLSSNICNLNTNKKVISDDTTRNVKNFVNFKKNIVAPNKYTNPAHIFGKSQLDIKTAEDISTNDLKLPQISNIETVVHQTGTYKRVPLDTSEYNNYNIDTNLDLDDTECSSSKNILYNQNDNDICSETNKLSRESENDSSIKLVENNNLSYDFNKTNDFSYTQLSNTLHLNEPVFRVENPYQKSKLKSTPYIFTLPKMTSHPSAKISDYTGSEVELIPSQNRLEHPVQQDLSSVPSIPLSPYIAVPLLRKEIAKELKTDSQLLQSSFPMYATLSDSQNTLLNPGSQNPSAASNVLPSPSIKSVVRLNKGSKYSPCIQEVRLPCPESPTPLKRASPLLESMLSFSLPNKEFPSSLASISSDHIVPVKDPGLFQSVPLRGLILPLEVARSMPPEHILLPSKLGVLPKSGSDCNTFSSNFLSTPIVPMRSTDAVNIPCRVKQTPQSLPSSQPNKSKLVNLTSGQFMPPYLEPLFPLKPVPKTVILDPSQLSSDKTDLCLDGDYPRRVEPISYMPLLSKTRLLGPSILPNTLICPNVMPSLPCTTLPDKSMLNNPSTITNYLTPGTGVQQDQILKQPIKDFPVSVVEQPYSINKILEITSSNHKPLLPVCTPPVQMDLSPCLDVTLDRNLPILSPQHIIQNPNIVDNEFSDAHSKTFSPALELTLQNQHSLVLDSSLIGSHLPTLSTTKPLLIDEKPNMNAELFLGLDLTDVTPLDSSLIGAHLDNESSPLALNSNYFHSKTSLPNSEVSATPSTQVENQLSIESQATNLLPGNSVMGPHLTTLSPLLSDEIQSINKVLPLDSDKTNLMPIDSSLIDHHIDFESQFKQLEGLQNKKPTVTLPATIPNPELYKLIESVPSNLIVEDLPLEHDFINLESLDTSLIGSQLDIGSSPIPIDSVEHKIEPTIPLDSFQNIGDKIADLESNILPSSLIPPPPELIQSTQFYEEVEQLSDISIVTPQTINSSIHPAILSSIPHTPSLYTDFKIIEPISELPSLDNKTESLHSKVSTVSQQSMKPSGTLDSENKLNSSLTGPSLHQYRELPEAPALLIKSQLESSLIGPNLSQEMEIVEKSVIDTKIQLESSLTGPTIESIKTPDAQSQLDNFLIGPTLQREINPLEIPILDSEIQLNNYLIGPTLQQKVKPSEMSTILHSDTKLDSDLIGSSLHQEIESKEVLPGLESSSQLDSFLTNPNLSTATFVSDKIYEELQLESVLTNFIPLDTSLIDIDTQADYSNELKLSKISQNEKPSLSLSFNPTNLNCYKSNDFLHSNLIVEELPTASTSSKIESLPSDLVGERLPLESTVSSIYTSDLQHLSPILTTPYLISELYPPTDLLASTAEISSDNVYPKLSREDLQTLTLNTLLNTPTLSLDFPSLPLLTLPAQKFLPEIIIKNEHPCLESNIITESLPYPKVPIDFKALPSNLLPFKDLPPSGFNFQPLDILASDNTNTINKYNNVPFGPQISISPYSPFVKIKPLLKRDGQVPQSFDIKNILQASSGLRPALNVVANIPLISGSLEPLPSNISKSFVDITSHSEPCPHILIPEVNTTVATILPPPLELTTPSNILSLNKYSPPLLKNTSSVLPSNLESTIGDSKYSPILLDDNFPLLDDNSFQLLKDISILPLSQSSIAPTIPVIEKGFPETDSQPSMTPSLLDTTPILNTDFIKTWPVLSIPITNPTVPLPIYSNSQNMPFMVQRPNIPPCNLQPYSNILLDAKFHETIGPIPQSIHHSNIPETTLTPLSFFDDSKMTQPCLPLLSKPILEDNMALLSPLSTNTLANAGYSKYMPQITTKPHSLTPQYKTLKSQPCSTALLEKKILQTSPINSLIPQKTLEPSSVYFKPTKSQWHELPNIHQLIKLSTNPIPNSEFSQQLLSKPCLESLDKSSQLPTVSNAFTSPISLDYTKPISNTISLSPVHPYSDIPVSSTSPLIPVKTTPLLGNPYPPAEVQTLPISSAIPSKSSQTFSRPYLAIHPKPFPIYTSPYSPNFISKLTDPLAKAESPVYSQYMSAPYFSPVPKEMTNLGSPAYSDVLPPISTNSIAPMHADLLSPSYASSVSTTYGYLPLAASINIVTGLSLLSPAYINPVFNRASHLPCNITLPSSSSRSLIDLKSQIGTPQIHIQRPLKTLAVSYAISPFLQANQSLPITPSILPMQSYPTPTHAPVSLPLPVSNSKMNNLQKNIPRKEILESNLQALPLEKAVSSYDNREKSISTYSNDDKGDKFYEKPSSKYPSGSFLYTLAPEKITETLPDKVFTKQDSLILSSPLNSFASESPLQSNLYQRPGLTPCTGYYSIPCSAPALPLPSSSLIDTGSPNLLENIPKAPSFSTPFSVPPLILSNPLLNPLLPVSPTLVSQNSQFPFIPNVPLILPPSSPISPFYNKVRPYNILPMNEKPQYLPLLSLPHYSAPSQEISITPITSPLVKYTPRLPSSPIDSSRLGNILSSQGTPQLKQVATISPNIAVSSQNEPSVPNIPENYRLLPPINTKPKPNTLPYQGSSVKPSALLSYDQYGEQIILHNTPAKDITFPRDVVKIQTPISLQYSTPLSALKPTQPLISPQYFSSILPTQTTLQDNSPMNAAPIQYQRFAPLLTGLTNNNADNYKFPSVALPFTVSPSFNHVDTTNDFVLPMSNILNNPPLSSFTPQYSLPSPTAAETSLIPTFFSSPESISPITSLPNEDKSIITPQITNQALADNILPSSLFTTMVTDFEIPLNKLSSLYNNPKYSLSSLALIEPLGTVPAYKPSKILEQTILPQNILKLNTQFSNGQAPLSSLPTVTQPLKSTDSYPSQPRPYFQHFTQPYPKLSSKTGQYIPPYLSPSHISLPLNTVPDLLLNEPSLPEYSAPVYNTPTSSSPLARNSFMNSDFKPIPCQSRDTSRDPLGSYSSPITSSAPLYSSSLLKPLKKSILLQKSTHPQVVPIISQYTPESLLSKLHPQSLDSASQLLPFPSPLLRSPLLKSLITNSQNDAPLLPMHRSSLNRTFPEMAPSKYLPSICNNEESFGPMSSLISKLPTTPESLLKSPFINEIEPQNIPHGSLPSLQEIPNSSTPLLPLTQSLLSTANTDAYPSIIQYLPASTSSLSPTVFSPTIRLNTAKLPTPIGPRHGHLPSQILTPGNVSLSQIPSYPQHQILERTSSLPIEASIIEATRPIEITAIPTSNLLEADMIPLPLNYIQQRQYYPIFSPNFIPLSKLTPTALPLQNKISQTSQYLSSTVPSITPLLSNGAQIVDNTDYILNSPIDTEPLIPIPSIDIKTPLLTNTPSRKPYNSRISYPDLLQLHPYITLLNTDYPQESTVNQYSPPQLHAPRSNNQPSPMYISPIKNRDFSEGPSNSHTSLSANVIMSPLTSTNIGSQLALGQLIGEPLPLRTSPLLLNSQIPIFGKSLPNHDVTPEKENLQTILNKYRPANIRPIQKNHSYEQKSSTSEVPLEIDSTVPVAPAITEGNYEEVDSNVINDNDSEITRCIHEPERIILDETKPNVLCLPEISEGLNVPINIAQRSQRLSNLDNFYANHHIGASPQVFNIPTYNKLPIGSHTYVQKPSNTICPKISKDFTTEPSIHFGSFSELDPTTHRPNDYYNKIPKFPTELPLVTKMFPENFLNPCLELSPPIKISPNSMNLPETSYNHTTYTPYDNTRDIRYMGYKTYQIPTFKSSETPENIETLPHIYSQSHQARPILPISILNRPNIHQIPNPSHIYIPIEIPDHLIPQYYQNSVKITSPLQTKLGLNTLQQSPKSNDFNLLEDIPISIDTINEDNELKTSLVNYINRKEEVKNNLYNDNAEVIIPIGNIAITKNEPYNANVIKTNNPSVSLKVWKSNVKIVQAELKLKLKELSVYNFMPIVNNLDKYDVEEIRKIVKNYIDEKYGNHIEVNEPYTIDNKYTVIKDFGRNAVDHFNLLWPTNYV